MRTHAAMRQDGIDMAMQKHAGSELCLRKLAERWAYISPPCEMRRADSMTSWKSLGSPVKRLFSSVMVTLGTGFLRPPAVLQTIPLSTSSGDMCI